MPQKIFDSDLIAICKNKITLWLIKPVYFGMCTLDLGKMLMHGFYYKHKKNMVTKLGYYY